MAGYNTVTMENLNNESVQKYMNEMKEKNHLLYSFIVELLSKNSSQGMREDVLQYISKNAESIGNKQDDLNYEYFVASMASDLSMEPEWYDWFDQYFSSDDYINIDDFTYLLNEAYTERKIPLNDLKELFNKGQNDVFNILDYIIAYIPEPEIDSSEGISKDSVNCTDSAMNQRSEVIVEDTHSADVSEHYGYVEMFDKLLSVMSYKGDEELSIAGIQNEMNKVIAKIQVSITEMSSITVEMLKCWEKDKDEIKKLKSLYSIQQNLLASQQQTIRNLKMDISKLKNKLSQTEKSDMQRLSLNSKLLEIQGLMSELSKSTDSDFDV